MDKRFLVCVEPNQNNHAGQLMLAILSSMDSSALISHEKDNLNLFLVLSSKLKVKDFVEVFLLINACVAVKLLPAKICATDFNSLPLKFKSPF